jgi:hypothetical protein
MDTLVTQITEAFKDRYGLKITGGADFLFVERNLLEVVMLLGRGVMGEVFQGMQNGYEGHVIEANERKYRFIDYHRTSLHGLYGTVEYCRALLLQLAGRGRRILPAGQRWVSKNGTTRVVSTFCPPSPAGGHMRRACSSFTRFPF